jgi:hypothetical protein
MRLKPLCTILMYNTAGIPIKPSSKGRQPSFRRTYADAVAALMGLFLGAVDVPSDVTGAVCKSEIGEAD